MRTQRCFTPLVLGLAVLALAACGQDEPADGAAAGNAREGRDAALKFARCMRENGVDMPDPRTDENGRVVIQGSRRGASDPGRDTDFRKADEACRRHLGAALPPKLSEEETQEFKRRALAHAKCMREQGIDFPDPQVHEGGGVSINLGKTGVDPSSPAFEKARKTCGDPVGKGPETAP